MADGQVKIQMLLDKSDYDRAINDLGKSTESSLSTAIKGSMIGNVLANVFSQAASMIYSSLDGAISRVDKLNQFPKVMQNIGFSAEEAESSIKKMSDGIQGLPTTLDEIVGNAQQLAMSIGDLDKATDVAIALNDGFLMFGASSADVTNAITQLNQMITSGKYDMQSWNSINQAAPGFLDTVARSMLGADASASQLRDALNSGKISSEEFTQALVDLDKNGGEGIVALSEGVKSATGGIETSMNNVGNAIVRNLGEIVDEINSNGEITAMFDTIKNAINDFGKVAVDAVGWIKDNFNDLAPLIGAIVAAFMGFQIVSFVSGLISAATGAFAAFNGVLAANPIGLVVAVIAFLVGYLITLYMTNEDVRNAINEAWGAITGAIGGAIDVIVQSFQDFVSMISSIPDSVAAAFDYIISNIWNFVSGMASGAIDAASQFASNLINRLQEIPGQVVSIGSNIVQGIVNGIMSAPGAVADALKNIVDGAINNIKASLGIHSPSTVFRDEVGRWIPAGIGEGIDKNTSSAIKPLSALTDELTSTASYMQSQLGNTLLGGLSTNITADTASGSRKSDEMIRILKNVSKQLETESLTINNREFARIVRSY